MFLKKITLLHKETQSEKEYPLFYSFNSVANYEYEMTEHYQITKYFLDHRQNFLKDILED